MLADPDIHVLYSRACKPTHTAHHCQPTITLRDGYSSPEGGHNRRPRVTGLVTGSRDCLPHVGTESLAYGIKQNAASGGIAAGADCRISFG